MKANSQGDMKASSQGDMESRRHGVKVSETLSQGARVREIWRH